jgi:hypothetical protein
VACQDYGSMEHDAVCGGVCNTHCCQMARRLPVIIAANVVVDFPLQEMMEGDRSRSGSWRESQTPMVYRLNKQGVTRKTVCVP